jgi:hypothetical protein
METIQRCYKCIDGLHVIYHVYFLWYVGSIMDDSMLVACSGE